MNNNEVVMEEKYYEKLYKIDLPEYKGKVFRYIDIDPKANVFSDFPKGDSRYWIEDEPKLVKKL